MDETYEQAYHDFELTNWWVKARRYLALHYLTQSSANRILDVGCAAGTTMSMLKEKGFSEIYGIDISESAVRKCALKNLNTFRESAEQTHFDDEFFDAIVASDVLEHTSSDSNTLAEWHRILKKGGRVLLFVPAFMHLWSSSDEINHHRKRYRLPEIGKLASESGFTVKTASYWNFSLYLPLVAVSFFKRRFHIRSENLKAVHPAINSCLYALMSLENLLVTKGARLPFGVSCFAILEKN